MSNAMLMMWISFVSMGFMFLAVGGILLSRYKIKMRWLQITISFLSYVFMIAGGLLMALVVFSGPSS